MKKTVLFTIIAVLVFGAQFVLAADKVRIYDVADKGEIEYPAKSENSRKVIIVWNETDKGAMVGILGCIVNDKTIVTSNRKGMNKENLDLLSGKRVTVLATIKSLGKGEGERGYCQKLHIFLDTAK